MPTHPSLQKQGLSVQLKYSEGKKLTLCWNAEDHVEIESVYHSASPEFDPANSTVIAFAAEGDCATFTRVPSSGRGYFHIRFKDGSVSVIHDRMIQTDGVINFRDMGGYRTEDGRTTRWGMLLRSADLHEMSERDLQMAEKLGIHWICDLRSHFEIAKRPSPQIGSAINTSIPFLAEANPEEMPKVDLDLGEGYRAMMLNPANCSRILRELLAEDRGTSLFHCAAGKDRTGVVCALVLLTLGVPRDVVIEDYELTNLAVGELLQRFMTSSKEYMEYMPKEQGEIPEYMKAAFIQASLDAIDEHYGSFERYLHEGLGITEQERTALKNKYLTNEA